MRIKIITDAMVLIILGFAIYFIYHCLHYAITGMVDNNISIRDLFFF